MRAPGIRKGLAAERPDREVGDWIEGLLARVRARLARGQFDRVIATIERGARDQALPEAAQTESGLQLAVDEVRRDLGIEGLRGPALARALALLREVAGQSLGMRPYDVQLFGAWVMTRGKLAEMATGEGKTLSAALAAAAAALAGFPVHVISCNDYLVARDAEAMRPFFESLGLRLGCVTGSNDDEAARCAAYACDVVYVTAHQLAFDYLRDFANVGSQSPLEKRVRRLEGSSAQPMVKGLVFAIVDEADQVLLDAARKPFVLSRPMPSSGQEVTVRGALQLAGLLEAGRHFETKRRAACCVLTDDGRDALEAAFGSELERDTQAALSHPRLREAWVERALAALHLYERETHYVVRDGRVDIVDQPSGRRMPEHAWDHGLHQLIESKEGCEISPRVEPVARITGQRLFARYLHLAGLTGTARQAAHEMARVYRLDCVAIPTRRPVRRELRGPRIFVCPKDHWSGVLDRIAELQVDGQPVLVATRSVDESEALGAALTERGLEHRVLNASQDRAEAEVIARAGRAGHITVATNMAGRGTDIALGPGVDESGGLYVLAIGLGESRRFDGQWRGRCARQGDPGCFEQLLCLEDGGVLQQLPGWLRTRVARWCGGSEANRPVISSSVGKPLVWLAQQAEENRSARARRVLIRQQREWESVLAFAGPQE